eukprot:4657275-Amphidinium_carterae.1
MLKAKDVSTRQEQRTPSSVRDANLSSTLLLLDTASSNQVPKAIRYYLNKSALPHNPHKRVQPQQHSGLPQAGTFCTAP